VGHEQICPKLLWVLLVRGMFGWIYSTILWCSEIASVYSNFESLLQLVPSFTHMFKLPALSSSDMEMLHFAMLDLGCKF